MDKYPNEEKRDFKYMNKKYIMALAFCIIIVSMSVITITITLYAKRKIKVGKGNNYIVDERNLNNNVKEAIETNTKSQEEKVSPSAKISMTQYYKKCGHTVKEEYKVPNAVVNMNKDEFEKYYSGWKVDSFSKDYIELSKINEGMCKEHYTIKDSDGYINIFTRNENGEEELYRATDIITKYLSTHDRLMLKKGVEVIGKSNLEKLIEDFQ